jgi:hypothetical protein
LNECGKTAPFCHDKVTEFFCLVDTSIKFSNLIDCSKHQETSALLILINLVKSPLLIHDKHSTSFRWCSWQQQQPLRKLQRIERSFDHDLRMKNNHGEWIPYCVWIFAGETKSIVPLPPLVTRQLSNNSSPRRRFFPIFTHYVLINRSRCVVVVGINERAASKFITLLRDRPVDDTTPIDSIFLLTNFIGEPKGTC